MSYKPKDQYFPPLVEGNVRTSGKSLSLGVGELTFVDLSKTTKDGVKILDGFTTSLTPTSKLAIRMGEPKNNVSRSEDNKAISTIPFKVADVTNIYVDAPVREGVLVDDFVIGWNGEEGSEISLDNAENEVIELTLKGDLMGMTGLPDSRHIATVNLTAPITGTKGTDWTDHEIVENAFIELKNYKLPGNIPITNYVDISLVNSENPGTLPGTPQTFYNLIYSDDGTQSNLGSVQAQYPALDVKKLKWESGKTTYSAIAASLPAAYQPVSDFILKGCSSCPSGYTEIAQGVVYEVVLENDGVDATSAVQGLPGAVGGSAVLNETVGDTTTYSVVTDNELTEAEIQNFIDSNLTALINLISKDVSDLCESAAPSTVVWVAGEACNSTTEDYTIVLKDGECGNSRLEEVKAAFPTLTVTEVDNGKESHAVTVTGTGGTANVTIAGTAYLVTFATNLTTTVANFVTAHGAAIETAKGYVVSGSGAVITLVGATSIANPTIANATGDLAGTVVTVIASNACQRKYKTTVNTTLVCSECDPIFRDIFESEAPGIFDNVSWKKIAKVYSATAKMGIRVKGIRAQIGGNELMRDEMIFFDGSVEISLVGGFSNYVNESYLAGTNERFTVKYFSRKADAQNLGGNLRKYEEEAQMHFRGRVRYVGNNYAKLVNGQETRLEGFKQYIIYSVTIAPLKFASDLQQPQNGAYTYHFITPLGKQEALEGMLNKLAAAAGLPQVQAVSK